MAHSPHGRSDRLQLLRTGRPLCGWGDRQHVERILDTLLAIRITLSPTKNKTTQISLYNVYLWNTVQEGTGVRPGQNETLDYSLSQKIALTADARWSVQVGAAGYGQWQTTENRGQIPARESLKYRVYGSGGTFTVTSPFKGLFAGGSLLLEYGARNTLKGRTATLSVGFSF